MHTVPSVDVDRWCDGQYGMRRHANTGTHAEPNHVSDSLPDAQSDAQSDAGAHAAVCSG